MAKRHKALGGAEMSGKNPLGNGKEPQSYEGINVTVPIGGWQFVRAKRDPTTSDKKYPVGTLWLNTVLQNVWMQTQPAGVWSELAASGANVDSVTGTTNQILASPTTGNVVLTLVGPYTPATYTAHGVLMGEGTSSIAASSAGTSGQVFTSGGASADGAYQAIGTNSGLTAHGVLLGENNSAFVATAAGTVGTVLASNGASADPTFQAIPSLNVVDNTTGTVASPTTMTVNTTYIADQASVTTGFLLPATAALGTEINIVGNGPGGWQIQQNANQAIKMNANTTTTGTSGSLSSTNRYNAITIVAVVGGASTIWAVNDFSGSFTFV